MRRKSSHCRVATISMMVALALTVCVSLVPTAAMAAGTSAKHYGCYAKWWNTAVSGYCSPATATRRFRLVVDCRGPRNYTGSYRKISNRSTVEPFDSIECAYGVVAAWVESTSA